MRPALRGAAGSEGRRQARLLGRLVMEQLFIGGEYVDSTSAAVIEVENPATEEVIAEVPDASEEDIDRVVDVARRAQLEWARTDAMTRCELLRECAQRFED